MKRILGALTQQAVPIEGNSNNEEMKVHLIIHYYVSGNHLPLGKNFTKIRPGTLGSCLTFLMNLYDAIVEADNLQVCENLIN